MSITTRNSILKQCYETNGQQELFGRDNLQFKTVNHPTKHQFVDLCNKFKLKKPIPVVATYTFLEITSVEVIGCVYY